MAISNRERLLSMVKGERNRSLLYHLSFGEIPVRPVELFESDEEPESEFRVVFGTRPELKQEVLRESKCLVRQADGSFKVLNYEKSEPVFIVENI